MGTWNTRGLRGSGLEDLINHTNERYRENRLALIQKVPTPITPIEIDKASRHITLAYFGQKSTVDYIGAVQGIPVCFDCAGKDQIMVPARFLRNLNQADARYRRDFRCERRGLRMPAFVNGFPCGAEAKACPKGIALPIELFHRLRKRFPIQIGFQATHNLQRAPSHAVAAERGVLLPLQRFPEGSGDQHTAARAKEEGQQRQHGEGYFQVKFQGSVSNR